MLKKAVKIRHNRLIADKDTDDLTKYQTKIEKVLLKTL